MIYKIMTISICMITMSMVIMMLCMVTYKKSFMDREKMSPYECGFDPKSSSRTPFSIQFFLIAVLFLIFDIEIVIILPMISNANLLILTNWFYTATAFFMILLVGLYYEWKNGVLEWAK
uniref:NADH-ubiquinone oxidoreductase chain 3 n=1 Tax=Orius niger TaxID=82746 RepID=B7SMI5_ORINI|nr:NADH dehydrogenase subunit 3 [Orius niger]ABZ02079.1 NADH dehydrogenase subunit 3 [Orius niger]